MAGSSIESELGVAEVATVVMGIMDGAEEGQELDAVTESLIALAVRACGTTLDLAGTKEHLEIAFDAGATPEQVQETLVLIAGIGIHGLIATSGIIADTLRRRGYATMIEPLDQEQSARFHEFGGDDPREARIAGVAPEFLPNLVRLSPESTVKAVMNFRAAPWFGETLTPLQREFIGISVDSMPSHRFLPTLRLHVARARELGAGRAQVRGVLRIAAAAPPHRGVR